VASSSWRARSAKAPTPSSAKVVGHPEPGAGVAPPALAAQPLAVEQLRAGELEPEAGTTQPGGGLVVRRLGLRAVAQQGPAPGLDAGCPVRVAASCCLVQPGLPSAARAAEAVTSA
jgi:hypothetical protein